MIKYKDFVNEKNSADDELYGYLQFKDGSDLQLDGGKRSSYKINKEIVGFGEDNLGDEANILVTTPDGKEKDLSTLKDVKKYFGR